MADVVGIRVVTGMPSIHDVESPVKCPSAYASGSSADCEVNQYVVSWTRSEPAMPVRGAVTSNLARSQRNSNFSPARWCFCGNGCGTSESGAHLFLVHHLFP